MPGRTEQSGDYRYGFNGKEKDENGEWGSQTHYDYGFRIYNPGIARFLSVDPLTQQYPFYTPYQFAGNMPIYAIDVDGLEPQPAVDKGADLDEGAEMTTTWNIGEVSEEYTWIWHEGSEDAGDYTGGEPIGAPKGFYLKADYTKLIDKHINGANIFNEDGQFDKGFDAMYSERLANSFAAKQLAELKRGNHSLEDSYIVFDLITLGRGSSILNVGKTGLKSRVRNLGNILKSYLVGVSGGEGLSLNAQLLRYIGTARYLLLRPSTNLPAKMGQVRLRHYTSVEAANAIKEAGVISAGRRNLVYNVAAGSDGIAKEGAESVLGIAKGRGGAFIEYNIDASRVQLSIHPWTNTVELNVKGAVNLKNAGAKFFTN